MITSGEAKRWLRRTLVRERQALSEAERGKMSRAVVSRLLRSPYYRRAKVIATFLGFGSEVQTELLLQRAWRDGKTLLIPMTPKGFHRPYFALFRKGDPTRRTRYGPLELSQAKRPFPFKKIDLVLIPGLGFDAKGHRLGYGGGVYDRILTRTPRARHVGLFFSTQEVHRLPSEKHDRRLHAVVTEKQVIRYLAKSRF